jgi:3-phosphoshikimate 1-carboxyvinyltransferase
MGAEVRIESDSLIIKGPARLKGARIETHHDHRLTMAFSVAALTAKGDTHIEDADSASISFPSFFEEFARLTR